MGSAEALDGTDAAMGWQEVYRRPLRMPMTAPTLAQEQTVRHGKA